ncbi:MAG: hypothetical protein GY750_19750 [Lentisphaerae bacterium]|nr:hypothetical protein [Lentisphaerota bacterium]MCP4103633.1 hypothetical protein [Lentisphaerota bacterium]
MFYVLIGVGAFVSLIFGFICWGRVSASRGSRKRDKMIINALLPICEKLEAKESISAEEVESYAVKSYLRPMLYSFLKFYERRDLFPERYLDIKSQGEAELIQWMIHPHEMQAPPDTIELIESIKQPIDNKDNLGEFLVYRYKMPADHWAAEDGWMVGIVGPYRENDVPYSGEALAFSRFDKYGEVDPNELVNWFKERFINFEEPISEV